MYHFLGWYSRTFNPKYNIVAIDCGIKISSVKALNARGCDVTVVPYDTGAEEILALKPDGIFISGGPGDPEELLCVIDTVKKIRGIKPILGTGNGASVIALAYGCKTYAMKNGHNGSNHSIVDIKTGKISVEYQSFFYCIDSESVKTTDLEITHINGFDKTIEGVADKENYVLASFFIPDAFYDNTDNGNIYNKFIKTVSEVRKNA